MDFSQFLSELLATVIGAGLALWGAIWLDRKAHRREERRRKQERRERANQVLSLILEELEFNRSALNHITDNVPSTYRQVKVESWQAFSDGGELKPIDDPTLLSVISTAYANIKHFIVLYNKFFDMKFFPEKNAYSSLQDVLLAHTMKAKHDSLSSVNDAIKRITEKLPNKGSTTTVD
jgi:hypothetical protein